jgi:hypothetical protein
MKVCEVRIPMRCEQLHGRTEFTQTTELQAALGQGWPNAEGVAVCAPQHVLVELPA